MTTAADRVEEYVRLMGQNQRRLYLYILSLVPNPIDAEEILQETHLVLWREFAQFQPGTNFAAWSCRVAFHQVLAWRKRRQRDRLQFSDTFLEAVAQEVERQNDTLHERCEALAQCIEKLPAPHRDLLRWRYSEAHPIEEVARLAGRTVDAVYRALSRIRHTLFQCVEQTLQREAP